MRPTRFHPEPLKRLLHRVHIATMTELKQALGTSSDATVFRKLEGLFYASSYSHRGSYYTLREIAEFDEYGLWSHRGVHFSEYGTLVSTAEHFVEQSEAGWQARELEAILQVSVKHYPTAVKIPDHEVKRLRCQPHHTLPHWNYTLKPRNR